MKTPNWSLFEFLNQSVMNTAAAAVSGSFNSAEQSSTRPGLVRPDALTIAVAGLVATVTAPSPFAILFNGGTLADAHGTTTGQDTQSYSVNFAGVVPGSGSVTAYLAATLTTIQQDAFQVIGPPPGHPDYNPNFVPYTAYATTVDTLSLSATTTAPDGITTMEIARATLAAGATGITFSTVYQQRSADFHTFHVVPVSGNTTLTAADAGKLIKLTQPVTMTLPPASGSNGLSYTFSSTSGTSTIQGQGADGIYGIFATPSSGVSSLPLVQGASVQVACEQNLWSIIGGSAQGIGVSGAPSGITSLQFRYGLRALPGNTVTASGIVDTNETVNAAAGTTYPFADSDRGTFIPFNNAAGVIATLATPTSGAFTNGWWVDVSNQGIGPLSLVPTACTIDGLAGVVLGQYQGLRIICDGTNYFTQRGQVAVTGDGKFKFANSSYTEAGWLSANGLSIGNSASSATARANADTQALFTLLWNNYTTLTVLPSRGSSAAADFAANRSIALPDMRGRGAFGLDDSGAAAAGRITGTTANPNGTTAGATGGAQTHAQTLAELVPHDHTVFAGHIQVGVANGSDGVSQVTDAPSSTTTNSAGSGTPFDKMSPFFLGLWMIKL